MVYLAYVVRIRNTPRLLCLFFGGLLVEVCRVVLLGLIIYILQCYCSACVKKHFGLESFCKNFALVGVYILQYKSSFRKSDLFSSVVITTLLS